MDRRQAMFATAALGWLPAHAQDKFPSHDIHIVVGYPPGGVTDISARVVGDILSKKYGQPVLVDNKPGASGVIAQQLVAKAPPDGYMLSSGGFGSNLLPPLTVEGLPLDVLKSFVPVALTAEFVNVLVIPPTHPAQTVAEFIKSMKARDKPMLLGANGVGSSAHLAGALFAMRTGLKMELVNYKGSPEILIDVTNGGLDCSFANLPTAQPLLRDGRLKALAVTSSYRSKHMPELPTMDESGVPNFNVTSWLGIYAPAGTPQPIVEQLAHDIVEGLQLPENRQRLESADLEVHPLDSAKFEAFTKQELTKWGDLVKRLNIRLKFGG